MKNPAQICMFIAAPCVTLFMVLAALAPTYQDPARGIDLWLSVRARSWQEAFDQCGDDRLIYLQILPGDRARINETPVSQADFPDLFRRIFETRQQHFLYFEADPTLDVGAVYEALGEAKAHVDRLRFIPMTPQIQREGAVVHDDFCVVPDRLWQRELAEAAVASRQTPQ